MMQPIKSVAGVLSSDGAPVKGGSGGDGESFLGRLSASLEELTGREVDSDQIAAWLAGDSPEGFPGGEELAKLLQQLLPGSGDGDAAALLPEAAAGPEGSGGEGEVDVAALIGALIASEGGGRAAGTDGLQQAKALSASLNERNPGAMRQLMDGLRPAAERGDGQGFRELMATVAALDDSAATAPRPATQSTATASLRVTTPVGQPGFTQAVGEQVTWMVRNEVQSARVQLDPPDLGPLEITVSLRDDRASVAIHAQHSATREALLADSTRLRAMLEDNGFTGVDVSVREDRPDSGGAGESFAGGGEGRGGGHGGETGGNGDGAAPADTTTGMRLGRGLVDHYV